MTIFDGDEKIPYIHNYSNMCRNEGNPTYADKNFFKDRFAFQSIS